MIPFICKKISDFFYENIDKNKDKKRGTQIFGCTLDFKKYNNLFIKIKIQ